MPRLCTVCTHPDHDAIDAELLEHRVGYRVIARRYGLVLRSVQRHAENHLAETLRRAKETKEMLSAQALADRVTRHDREIEWAIGYAKRTGDVRGVLLALETNGRVVDRLARLAVLRAAEQAAEQERAYVDAEPPVWDESPETIRTVLRMMVEAGAAASPSDPATPEGAAPAWPRQEAASE